LDLNAASMFVQVVQGGSLSAGAARAGVPLATLSRRIRALERELKVQLFERSTRGARLTDAGQRLYEHAVRGVEALADGERALMSDQARLKGRLRLTLPEAFEPWWRLLAAFQARYPEIELSIYVTERRVDLVQDGIDVALRIGPVTDESLVARRLATYRHVLVASPAFLDRFGGPTTPDDLARLPCAVWTANPHAPGVWRVDDGAVRVRAILATNDYLHLRELAAAGAAATELPPFLAAPLVAEGRLVRLLPEARFPEQALNLLYPAHRYPSTLVRAYLDFCREHAARHLAGAGEAG
jgi:DNA-binding transcriptional LysR family regulator